MIKISNHKIRLLWLQSNGLQNKKIQKLNVLQIIKDLGFVQLDTIQNVTRAHHHILWSRNSNYKEHMLDDLLLEKGAIFEHFTHDASVLPVEFYPVWKIQFKNLKEKIDKSKYYKNILDTTSIRAILDRIKKEGALNIKDSPSNPMDKKKMWSKSAYKATLEYMWYCGVLSTAYRKNFRKYYDLSENIIPHDILNKTIPDKEKIHWICVQALDKMSVANAKEIKNFWEAMSVAQVHAWIANHQEHFTEVCWENSKGKYIKSFAPLDIKDRLEGLKNQNSHIKIINPFDPAIRDRKRLENIFGFEYKIEIFVPKAKRVWGIMYIRCYKEIHL